MQNILTASEYSDLLPLLQAYKNFLMISVPKSSEFTWIHQGLFFQKMRWIVVMHLPSFHLSTSDEDLLPIREEELSWRPHVRKFQVLMSGPTCYKYHRPQRDAQFVLLHPLWDCNWTNSDDPYISCSLMRTKFLKIKSDACSLRRNYYRRVDSLKQAIFELWKKKNSSSRN